MFIGSVLGRFLRTGFCKLRHLPTVASNSVTSRSGLAELSQLLAYEPTVTDLGLSGPGKQSGAVCNRTIYCRLMKLCLKTQPRRLAFVIQPSIPQSRPRTVAARRGEWRFWLPSYHPADVIRSEEQHAGQRSGRVDYDLPSRGTGADGGEMDATLTLPLAYGPASSRFGVS